VAKALEFGHRAIACASTGNAASSLAGMAASVGLPAFIFVPERAPEPKVAQLLMFGATVFRVRGTYEQAFDLCRAACERFRWYNRNSGTNPYLVEGKKTAGLEIAEQFSLGAMLDGALPDWVAVSVGDGCTIGGITKGLHESKRLGLARVLPRMLGVQAEAAIVRSRVLGRGPVGANVADNHAVMRRATGGGRSWVRASRGAMIASDDAILDAMRETARLARCSPNRPEGSVAACARPPPASCRRRHGAGGIAGNLKDIRAAMSAPASRTTCARISPRRGHRRETHAAERRDRGPPSPAAWRAPTCASKGT
jgi:threonine synthase